MTMRHILGALAYSATFTFIGGWLWLHPERFGSLVAYLGLGTMILAGITFLLYLELLRKKIIERRKAKESKDNDNRSTDQR